MKILFIVGSLEPGRDGVGDYTRRLAGALIRLGHDCRLVAINDRHVAQASSMDHAQEQDGIQVFRLPRTLPWRERTKLLRKWVEAFAPDWVSLQFVPYSFQVKGLPVGLGSRLKQMAPAAKWHVMFHELWVGMEQGCPLRLRLVGGVQRRIIKTLLRRLNPVTVHTHSALYLKQLNTIEIVSYQLPLFGNIPIAERRLTTANGCHPCASNKSNSLRLVHFGNVRPNVPVTDFAVSLEAYATSHKKAITMSLVGISGKFAEPWKTAFESAGISFIDHGEKVSDQVSRLLLEADIGIITTPIALAEKSGAFAAMREHGLPVIALTNPWSAAGIGEIPSPPGVFAYVQGGLQELLDRINKSDPVPDAVERIANRMMNDLLTVENAMVSE